MKSGKPKIRKRKKQKHPVTRNESMHRQKARCSNKLVSKLHELVKELDQTEQRAEAVQGRENKVKINAIQAQIDELGGLEAYQTSSQLGKSHHGNVSTAKWILSKLKEFNIRAEKGHKLKLLDVGALELNYTKQCKWIECTAIDLNPHSAGIVKADFLQFQNDTPQMYDIIVMSLVLNFAGSPAIRGDMLKKCSRICKPKGHLFVILPLACLENSRYLTHDTFHDMLDKLGFQMVSSHNSRKLSFKMFTRKEDGERQGRLQRQEDCGKNEEDRGKTSGKRKTVRGGVKCNNFSIVIR
ncbi:uncharacterized protein [Amphiura filiformis]|uniref:uncharacterized protein n=1 Tax=Amphiura filiformis TaxID=82378 RepID=UPI003B21AF81